ncbi:hypothetical protein [Dyella kyungheensis]|uniref:Cytochrome oxidase Cu insertion factor (SCO1/SenC/PrrC family) n=1 Tax=Dyella kyungheensis TaxID=1242174 RepID=A0ABS2JZC7_9GAMM|nr:hypothetical protein [Dyella kyungheensis]MBM7123700.1 hypothetical protein [Dyella kyungheensis]
MTDPTALRASRLKLLLIMLVFAAPIIVALVLTFAGWQPSGKANGQPVTPQRNFAAEQLPISLSNGDTWAWRAKEPQLTLVALAGPGCAKQCLDVLTKMAAARITLNRNAPRLRLLYVGRPPADAVASGMTGYWKLGQDPMAVLAPFTPTTPDSVAALLVESDGTALSFYPVGFDATGLRKDLQKVIR